MKYFSDYSKQFIKELEALPREYTMTMAKRNRDVIYQMILNFNIGRFLIFVDNYNNGIPDKIRITKFRLDIHQMKLYDKTLFNYKKEAEHFVNCYFFDNIT